MDRTITALRKQNRNPNRINIHLDGEFAFGISRILAAWLQVGQKLSAEKIAALKGQDNVEMAYQRALHFINYKPRSEHEVRQKLLSKGDAADIVEPVLDKLKNHQLIQDESFARFWVENRITFRPRSYRLMAYELRQKGVTQEVIEDALSEVESESELAYRAVKRRAGRFERDDWRIFKRQAVAYLSRRGFNYATSAPAVLRIWEELQVSSGIDIQQEHKD